MAEINIGQISEALNDKADRDLHNVDTTVKADAIIDFQAPTAENNYTWYRKYKSGWVEQGGETPGEAQSTALTINLPVIMANSNYYVGITSTVGGNGFCFRATSRTTTTFVLQPDYFASSANPTGSKVWQVSGMAAE